MAVVFEPAVRMSAVRIAMRPMDHAAFVVPFVFAPKPDAVACAERFDSRREIDVVSDQDRLI